MLLKEGQESLASGSVSPRALTLQRHWRFYMEPVVEDDVAELTRVTLEAFKDDAMVNGCFREGIDPRVRREQETQWRIQRWQKMLRHPESGQWCIKVIAKISQHGNESSAQLKGMIDGSYCSQDDGVESQLVGYATWLDNSAEPFAQASTVGEDAVIVEPECLDKEAYEAICQRIQKMAERVLRGRKDVWHLEHLAVHPAFQRMGIGTMLLRWGVERANLTGCAVYTEASRAGMKLYRKFWLERIRKIGFASGGCRIAMLRQPIEW